MVGRAVGLAGELSKPLRRPDRNRPAHMMHSMTLVAKSAGLDGAALLCPGGGGSASPSDTTNTSSVCAKRKRDQAFIILTTVAVALS